MCNLSPNFHKIEVRLYRFFTRSKNLVKVIFIVYLFHLCLLIFKLFDGPKIARLIEFIFTVFPAIISEFEFYNLT